MKLKLTTAQAEVLHRLLGETSTARYSDVMSVDLNSNEIWAVWDQLDDKLAERNIASFGYGQM